jgi:hypothetical protein
MGKTKTLKEVTSEEVEGLQSGPPNFFYCLEESHPGAPSLQSEPVSVARIFAYSGEGCPVCPDCNRPVSSIPCQEDVPPQSIIELAGRQ